MHQFQNSREEREFLDKMNALRNAAPNGRPPAAETLIQPVSGPIPIPAAVESLHRSINELGQAISALNETLGPFLEPADSIVEAATPAMPPNGQAPMTMEILRAEESVREMRRWLNNITERVCA